MLDLITIGDAVIDTHVNIDNASAECNVDTHECRLCLDYATKVPITDTFQTLGGNAANTACGAVKLGLKSAILSTLGRDTNARIIASELKKKRVDTSLLQTDVKTKTRSSVVLNFRGERTILSYHEKRNYRFPKKMPATEWIYYTSLSEGFDSLQDDLLKFLGKHSTVKIAFNPGSYQLANAMDRVHEMLPMTDLLIVNMEEALMILNSTLKKEKTPTTIIRKLLGLGVKEVAITDSINGAYAGNEEEIWYMPIYPIEVVSKTGAGDAFSAGYIAAKHYDHDIHTSLRWGVANSACVVSQHGPQAGQLNAKDVTDFIKDFPKIAPQKIS